jgi:Lon protease-like protein
MTEDSRALDSFAGTARLFPLPNLVLFPGATQGLHIFEPRYRQLMADTLIADRLFALVLLKPGWDEHYDGKPNIEPVACLGRVTQHEKLPDGRYNLQLKGLARIRIDQELPTETLYRQAKATVIKDDSPSELVVLREARKRLAAAVLSRFLPESAAYIHLSELFNGELPLGPLCDQLSYALPIALELKQALLAEPQVLLRVEILYHAMVPKGLPRHRPFPPDFSSN